ncbi:hypothetical protein PAPYR_3099 [Paratrimastix pyriformis]|uniref:Uncharacterized protein n=1 Tax=Paratrimastix pyriformis TaxID=342808 RepID=A0ABQ8UUS4_9EUKA|nr:hypothetical protein PAPYR_3099 [Paratrimastix pyriformis]
MAELFSLDCLCQPVPFAGSSLGRQFQADLSDLEQAMDSYKKAPFYNLTAEQLTMRQWQEKKHPRVADVAAHPLEVFLDLLAFFEQSEGRPDMVPEPAHPTGPMKPPPFVPKLDSVERPAGQRGRALPSRPRSVLAAGAPTSTATASAPAKPRLMVRPTLAAPAPQPRSGLASLDRKKEEELQTHAAEVASGKVPACEHPKYVKYFRLLKMGAPRAQITVGMHAEGLDTDVLDDPQRLL